MSPDLKAVIAANLRVLLKIPEGRSGVAKLMALGITNGNASRALGGQTSIGVDLLQQLAEKLGVEPWQLCVPGLDSQAMPRLNSQPAARWPFTKVDQEVVSNLKPSVAVAVETGLLIALAGAGVSPRKQPAAA